MLVGKQGLSLKQQGKIYNGCLRPVLLYCGETWEFSVADEARLRGVKHHDQDDVGVRLVDRCRLMFFVIGWVLL